ncbi:MAG TPA: immunoglobulin-like domain-containing protein [Solirubrobacterales bacterium]|nr:immunoglobulin-like domain-containing protein [Solirubrobacterales bacterium]
MSIANRAGIALLPLLVLSLLGAPSIAAASESEPPFCEKTVLRNYLAPLKRMPKLHELPFRRASENRFRGVYVSAAGPSLAVNGGKAGYQLQWDTNPRWDVTLTFARVNGGGKVVEQLGQRHLRLGELGPALITEPGFTMPGKPATYRTTLAIHSSTGRKLAEFGNYYRVIRPTVHVHLAPDATIYRPGITVFARIENPGAAFILFGDGYAIEALEGDSWVPAPVSQDHFVTPLSFVTPGTAGSHCITFPIPTSIPTGRYRASQETVISWPFERRERRPTLHAEFEVAAP